MTRTITLAGYGLIALLIVLAQLAATRSDRLPTIGRLLSVVLDRRAGWLLAVVSWTWVGVHLFVRSTPGD
jgi:hypothetical protein